MKATGLPSVPRVAGEEADADSHDHYNSNSLQSADEDVSKTL